MKKNIVLIHGWGASVNKLAFLKGCLENSGWNVLSVKMPGFDLKSPKESWSVDDYAKFVKKEASKHFKDNDYFIFGHSFGGRIVIKILAYSHSNVSGGILCSSGGVSRSNIVKIFLFFILAKVGKLLMINKKLSLFFRKILYKASHEHDYEKTSGVMKDTFKKVISEDLKSYLPKIELPVLVLWGSVDKITPLKDAFLITKLVKNSKLNVYDDYGHKLPYQAASILCKDINKWYKHLQ